MSFRHDGTSARGRAMRRGKRANGGGAHRGLTEKPSGVGEVSETANRRAMIVGAKDDDELDGDVSGILRARASSW